MTNIIVYHKNCMDGVSSAFIASQSLTNLDNNPQELLPLHYGEEQKLFDLIEDIPDFKVTMVDFSFKRVEMVQLLSLNKPVAVIDHHATAEAELSPLISYPNFTFIFDNKRSGATLTFDTFSRRHNLNRTLFEYIEDRDLWNWKMPASKEVSEYLAFKVKPNDIKSFEEAYNLFNLDHNQFIGIGDILLQKKQQAVDSKTSQAQEVTINNIPFMIVNATENVSEIGNAIVTEYKKPACIFFFIDDFKVVLSFRSDNTLQDVSQVATTFPGGGGHRNSSGCTVGIKTLEEILLTNKGK